MQVSATQQKFANSKTQTTFEAKGVPGSIKSKPHRFPLMPTTSHPTMIKPVIAFGKPPAVAGASVALMMPRPSPQFPPTPSTIIKPPRFYSNQSLIIPRSKPNQGGQLTAVRTDDECICERDDAIIICQKCGSELIGRVQQKCAAHPRKIPLMDYRECLNTTCRSVKLVEVAINDHEL